MTRKDYNTRVIIITAFMILLFSLSDYLVISKHTENKIMMDTPIEITVYGRGKKRMAEAVSKAFDEIKRLESLLSSFISESEISRINDSNGNEVEVSEETAKILEESQRINEISHGAFDVTLWELSTLWGVTNENPKVPDDNAIKELLSHLGSDKIVITKKQSEKGASFFVRLTDPLAKIDLGGIAEGYAIKRAAEILRANRIKSGFIDAGGDIIVIGKKKGKDFKIGIKSPDNDSLIGVVSISDMAVVTSGDYERYFIQDGIRYHHILDPKTGYPARACRSVTVITKDAMLADALSTAIFVLGPEKGTALANSLEGVHTLIIGDKNEVVLSKNALDYIELDKGNESN